MIFGHLLGVAYESVRGGADLVLAMITGEKAAFSAPDSVRPATARPVLAGLVVSFCWLAPLA